MEESKIDHEAIDFLRAFNESGIIFQQWCIQFIKEKVAHWQVSLEEFPVSAAEENTRIDFVALADKHYLVVECKQCNPKYKAWIFPKSFSNNFPLTFSYGVQKNYHNSDVGRHSFDAKKNLPDIKVGETNFYDGLSSFQSFYSLEAKQTRGKLDKNFCRESIEDACYQVTQSFLGLMNEKWNFINGAGICETYTYYPIILTTAELFHIAYNPLEGILPDNKFKNIPYVIFNYGVPDPLWQFAIKMSSGRPWNPYKKLPILIVNKEHIGEFFAQINNNLFL